MKIPIPSPKDIDEIVDKIIRDCYRDYNIFGNDIIEIINSDNFRLKQKLFSKIIYNSKDRLNALLIFSREDLEKLLNSFSPGYNEREINRHFYVLRNIYLNEKNKVEGLEWKKR